MQLNTHTHTQICYDAEEQFGKNVKASSCSASIATWHHFPGYPSQQLGRCHCFWAVCFFCSSEWVLDRAKWGKDRQNEHFKRPTLSLSSGPLRPFVHISAYLLGLAKINRSSTRQFFKYSTSLCWFSAVWPVLATEDCGAYAVGHTKVICLSVWIVKFLQNSGL